jgi:Putative auto-transporter adhesin, head GIN domain
MKQLLLIAAIFSGTLGVAQKEKNIVYDANVQVRQVKDFIGIDVSGAIDVYLSQSNEEAVAISGSDIDIVNKIKTEVRNGVLHIFFDNNGLNFRNWGNSKLKAYITFKNIEKIISAGACNIIAAQPIHANTLLIDLSGASDFKGEVNATTISIDASGAASIKITGKAEQAKIDCSGASDVKGYGLVLNYCKARSSGASSISITVNKELNADASGASDIYFKGDANTKNISSSGGSSIKRRVDKN